MKIITEWYYDKACYRIYKIYLIDKKLGICELLQETWVNCGFID